jgi:hypothetical protein
VFMLRNSELRYLVYIANANASDMLLKPYSPPSSHLPIYPLADPIQPSSHSSTLDIDDLRVNGA